jgi:L-threonylcarbamoyladenylate synthase
MRPEIERAVALLRRGELVAFPTETVYGLGADAANPAAVARIFAAKGRPADHPLIVHLPAAEHLARWARDIPAEAEKLAAAFWPGPLTLILKRQPQVPNAVTGGQDTVGLRVPSHPLALELLRAFEGGIAAPSANRFGRISPTTAAHVREELGERVPLVLDGGACPVGIESTILDLSRGVPVLLRPGAIGPADIARVLGRAFARNGRAARRGAARVGRASMPTTRRARRCSWCLPTACSLRCAMRSSPAKGWPCWRPRRRPSATTSSPGSPGPRRAGRLRPRALRQPARTGRPPAAPASSSSSRPPARLGSPSTTACGRAAAGSGEDDET